MNFNSIIDNVRSIISLNDEEINLFTSFLEQQKFKKKTFVVRAGEVCRYETFVVKGCVRIFYIDQNGFEHVVKFATENWWAFDLQSFVTKSPAFYSIQAVVDAETFQISKENHDILNEKIPQFEKFFRIMFQNSYILLQHRLTQNLYASAEEKYLHFKEKYPGLEQRIPQKEIAAYLGITPVFLSMLRKKRR